MKKKIEIIPEKIRVVHIITKLELGGAQINTIYTYENLDDSMFIPYLFSGPGGILTDRIKKRERFAIIPGLIRSINPFKDLKTFFRLRKKLKEIEPHIVHTHSSKAGILGRLAAFSTGVPVVVHSVHGFSFSPHQSFLKRSFFVAAEKLVSGITDHFIFVAKEDIETAKRKKLVVGNFSLIRSGFPIRKFIDKEVSRNVQRTRFGIDPGDFVCGIIAPFKPQKGLFHLVEIAEKVLADIGEERNVLFLIAGDGELRESLEKVLKEKGILDHFRLPGFVFDVENAIETFDLGLSTALWEGLPQSLVQLRLKKKAVVASDITGNREVIRDGENGYLADVFDHKNFAQRVVQLILDKETRDRLANFNDDYSQWDAAYMVHEQEKLYQSLLQLAK